ncbi:recombinase family protein [Orrella sp. NBD-18]|uniref:Recombinase family protein n=1 Tax=Sheuella amnicola TaxID=2707330 RepID=A0A6B2QZZ5_9BURK|nr:recombinase family protein [Sheuella amnicola]NDY82327.1 recombinase family protein [Sheuella amnicola]
MAKSKAKSPENTLHIYTRVSTVTQADKGTSLDSQQQLGLKKAKELKFDHEIWNEGGKSSHHDDIQGRPKLYELFQAIKAGDVKHIWVYDQSRLSRNDQVASILRYEFNKQGVTLYTKDGKFDLSSPSDKLLKQMLDAVAEFENSVRAERSRIGKLMKVKAGFWHGGPPPFGYDLIHGKLVEKKDESKWVKLIFKQALKGVPVAQIKRELDSNGVLARRGGLWTLGSIESLMTNTHYLGRYVFTDSVSGESVEVKCPVIVDEVTWNSINLARKRKASRKDQQNATVKNFYLLRDFMVCGHCGRKMAGRIKPSKSEYMYYCPNKERVWAKDGESKTHYQRGTGCGFDRAMNIQITDKLVFDTVVQLHKDSSILKEEVRKRIFAEKGIKQISSEAEMKGYEKQHRILQRELSNLQESIGHLEANRILKRMDDKAFKSAMDRLNEQADLYKTDITNLRLKLRGETEKKEWVDWVGMFGEEIKEKAKLTDEQRQLYLQGLIEKIECRFLPKTRDHELEIHFKHPIVGDKLKWNDPKVKAKGYKLLEGSKTTQIRVEKRDGRGK